MKYLLDSNTLSDFYNDKSAGYSAIVSHMENLKETDEIYVSILSLYEFEYRFANAPDRIKPQIRTQIHAVCANFVVLSLPEAGADIFGKLKKQLHMLRNMKPENLKKYSIDLMLAATAIVYDCMLISEDGVFSDLKTAHTGFRTANWLI